MKDGYDPLPHYCPGLTTPGLGLHQFSMSDEDIVEIRSNESLALITTDYGRKWRSRTELEIDRMDLGEQLFLLKAKQWSTEERLHREMETSIRIGAQLIRAEERIRDLEFRLATLGHRMF